MRPSIFDLRFFGIIEPIQRPNQVASNPTDYFKFDARTNNLC